MVEWMFSEESQLKLLDSRILMNAHNEVEAIQRTLILETLVSIQSTWSERFDTIEIAKHSETMWHCYMRRPKLIVNASTVSHNENKKKDSKFSSR